MKLIRENHRKIKLSYFGVKVILFYGFRGNINLKALIYCSDKFKVNVSIRNQSHFLINITQLLHYCAHLLLVSRLVPCIYDVLA